MSDDDDNEDRYDRAEESRSAADAIGEVAFSIETLGYSPEWWERRDREVAEERAREAAKAEQQRMTKRAGDLRDNEFPELFVAAALGELDDTTALKASQTFRYTPRKLLVLAGGVGVGKTTAGVWVLLKGDDPRPGFVRVSKLERNGRYDKPFDAWLEERTSLLIDDVGSEYMDGKGAFRSRMDEIVDAFYADRRTLVMTTNLRPTREKPEDEEQFRERYGERVWSRLHQSGVWVNCGTRDRRREPQP